MRSYRYRDVEIFTDWSKKLGGYALSMLVRKSGEKDPLLESEEESGEDEIEGPGKNDRHMTVILSGSNAGSVAILCDVIEMLAAKLGGARTSPYLGELLTIKAHREELAGLLIKGWLTDSVIGR